METHTFQVKNIREGLERIKYELGPHAVIVHTKRVNGPKGDMLEITASVDPRKMPAFPPEVKRDANQRRGLWRNVTRQKPEDEDLDEATEEALEDVRASVVKLTELVGQLTGQIGELQSEVRHLRLEQVKRAEDAEVRAMRAESRPLLANPAAPVTLAPVPTSAAAVFSMEQEVFRMGLARLWSNSDEHFLRALFTLHRALLSRGVLEADVEALIAHILAGDVITEEDDPGIDEYAVAQMSQWLPVAEPLWEHGSGDDVTHVHVLIGPSGVGKTTLVAKLAAHARYGADRNVGLVCADAYRIGGHFQLETYAELLDVPLVRASSRGDLRAALEHLHGCDMVLVDTTSHNPWDPLPEDKALPVAAFDELAQEFVGRVHIHVHHVLAANAHPEDQLQFIARSGAESSDSVIFTKIDEARHLGAILSVVRACGLPVSVLSNGRAVPGDLVCPESLELAQWVLRGWPGAPEADDAVG
ncbi:MAG: hypothetical protein AAGI01_02015 [Myxococcota bacterium]